ncbi:MAG: hypothetical protein ABI759_32970 [Candidatus Solibacter sp.]
MSAIRLPLLIACFALIYSAPLHAATTILAATEVGPVKSTNGGAAWQIVPVTVNSGLLSGQPSALAIAVDPKTPDTTWYLYGTVSGAYGFFKTADAGQTWSGTPLTGFHPLRGIAIDPVTTGTMYMVATSNNVANFLVKSSNFGASWTTIQLPATTQFPASSFPNGASVQHVVTDPRISGLVYAAAGNYLFKSTDYGVTWTVLSTGVGAAEGRNPVGGIAGGFPSIGLIAIDPHKSEVIYVASSATSVGANCKATPGSGQCGLYKSADNGVTWTPLTIESPGVYSVSIDPASGAIYAGAEITGIGSAVSKSGDNGVNWTPIKNNLSPDGSFVMVDANSTNTVYAFPHLGFGAGGDTYVRSGDGGATWATAATPHLCALDIQTCNNPFHNTIYDMLIVPPPAGAGSGPPAIAANGVVNGASFQPGIVPNSWVTIVGANLAPLTDDWSHSIVNGKFPTVLDGVSVSIGGKPAFLKDISPGQLNLLAPDIGLGLMEVTVTNGAATSAVFTVTSSQYGPAFFVWPGSQAVATRTDYTYAVKPGTFSSLTTIAAKPGDILILWGTGFGPANPAAPSGTALPADRAYPAAVTPTVTVNGVSATVFGAALAPGFASLYQVAIQIPGNLADGDWPVVAAVGGVQSPVATLLAIRH